MSDYLINDYKFVLNCEWQTYTDKELQVPGIRLFGHFSSQKASEPLSMHVHPGCMEICYIVRGNQTYYIGDKTYELTGGDVFVTFPDELHGSGSEPQGKFEIFWMQLEMAKSGFLLYDRENAQNLKSALLSINSRHFKSDSRSFQLIKEAFVNIPLIDPVRKMLGVSSLTLFLSKNFCANNKLPPKPATIAQAELFIKDNLENKITLTDTAEHIGLSLSYFKKLFKASTGETPGDYINYLKIQRAKKLLEQNSVTQTAFILDFSSSSYFSSVFKHYMGTSPMQYQKKLKDLT